RGARRRGHPARGDSAGRWLDRGSRRAAGARAEELGVLRGRHQQPAPGAQRWAHGVAVQRDQFLGPSTSCNTRTFDAVVRDARLPLMAGIRPGDSAAAEALRSCWGMAAVLEHASTGVSRNTWRVNGKLWLSHSDPTEAGRFQREAR